MQIIKTIVWVLLIIALLGFSYFNWQPVEVRIWENLVLETKIPMLVVVSFFIGLVPMWMINRAQKWHSSRKITSLESAARTAATTPIAPREIDEEEVAASYEEESASYKEEIVDEVVEGADDDLSINTAPNP